MTESVKQDKELASLEARKAVLEADRYEATKQVFPRMVYRDSQPVIPAQSVSTFEEAEKALRALYAKAEESETQADDDSDFEAAVRTLARLFNIQGSPDKHETKVVNSLAELHAAIEDGFRTNPDEDTAKAEHKELAPSLKKAGAEQDAADKAAAKAEADAKKQPK